MTIQVTWLDKPNNIIQLQFEQDWSLEEIADAMNLSNQLNNDNPHPGTLALDLRQVSAYKSGFIPCIHNLLKHPDNFFEHIVFIGASSIFEEMMTLLFRTMSHQTPTLHFMSYPEHLPIDFANLCA